MSAIHLNGLNGIRAIAALIVVFSHVGQALAAYELPEMQGLDMASYGVTIFFTLSGFLITFLLLSEKKKFGTVSIKKFYIRRILRIWPLYYLYLLISVISLYYFDKHLLNGNLIFFILMMANVPYILSERFPVIVHFWSLGVEEQFYLFWPWVVKNREKLTSWLIAFILVMMFLKFISWVYFLKSGNKIPMNVIHITRFHCMAIGAFGAALYQNRNELFIKISVSKVTQFFVFGVLFICLIGKFNIAELINDEIVSVISVFLIMNAVLGTRPFKFLNNSILDYIGRISFGVYVYHPLILYLGARFFLNQIKTLDITYQYIVIYTATIILTLFVSAISFKYFEGWFLRLKDKFMQVKSSAV